MDNRDRYTAITKIAGMSSEQVLKVLAFMAHIETKESTTPATTGKVLELDKFLLQNRTTEEIERW